MNGQSICGGARWRTAFAWLAAALLAAACGGGGSDGLAAGATAFTEGTITGFGSIIVNGVRFDDRRATVTDDDDQARVRSELKLGMTVEILSDRVRAASAGGSTATAHQIRFGAEIVGPVEAIDIPNKRLTVLGQIVEVGDTTVFDDNLAGGLTALALGNIVEVHARFDLATGHYLAKRIEREAQVNFFRLRGLVSGLDTINKTFKIGGATISYANVAAADLPPNFADGQRVRVRLQTTAVNGVWQAVSVRTGVRKVEDHDEAHVRGVITSFTDITSFSVNGLPVTTSAATKFPDGTAGIVLGAEVEVEGAIRNGVLVATEVELEDEHKGDDDRLNELHGVVADFSRANQTFTVHGVKVHFSATTTVFVRGGLADLANGKAVEVKGRLAADGVTVEALLIKFET